MSHSPRWPVLPDAFESHMEEPEGVDHGDAWYFICIDGQLVCTSVNGMPSPVTADDFRWFDVEVSYRHYLGRYQNRSVFAVAATGALPEGYSLAGLRGWLGRVEESLFYLAGRAIQIVEWHQTHQFCGKCGEKMVDQPEDRAKRCPSCRHLCYPRLSPSIIVLVTRGNEMLLARNAAWPNGMFSTLAGFVEPGESIEQTVHREVFEEVGLKVGKLRYLGSQSWPFPNSLMLGFHAEYAGGDIVYHDGEIADARWFTADNLPNIPPATAISRWLIDDFLSELKG